ncbi:hypothetical protein [Candidatus Palauibacter sp.]|uniref:hypothetical protein n=1 Tax=Candidatus Palauibacter sp. TaxID=3101350 RepID=UPI003AF2D4CF
MARPRCPRLAALVLTLLITSGCWRLGDAIPSDALVTWVAYPETVRVDAPFSFEFAGPVSPDGCGRLDTATLAVTESSIELAARRSTFRAMCAPQHISFYEARPLTIGTPGEYVVRAPTGIELGTLVATDTGRFSAVRTWGEGTIREAAGCWLFGPGWIGSQRVFALDGLDPGLQEVGTNRVIYVRGQLRGFISCGNWGSRPRIRVDTAWATEKRVGDLYP